MTSDRTLFDAPTPSEEPGPVAAPKDSGVDSIPHADGETYDPVQDYVRLADQGACVWRCMMDGKWRTLGEISKATRYPESSIGARLRDFRKPKWGEHTVDRRQRAGCSRGIYEYRLERRGGCTVELPEHETRPVTYGMTRTVVLELDTETYDRLSRWLGGDVSPEAMRRRFMEDERNGEA